MRQEDIVKKGVEEEAETDTQEQLYVRCLYAKIILLPDLSAGLRPDLVFQGWRI